MVEIAGDLRPDPMICEKTEKNKRAAASDVITVEEIEKVDNETITNKLNHIILRRAVGLRYLLSTWRMQNRSNIQQNNFQSNPV